MLDAKTLRKDFKMLEVKMADHPLVYFDNAATTFKPSSVIDAINKYYATESVSVHRGDYEISYRLTSEVEQARQHMASFINANAHEIIYMSGATEALNQVAYGFGLDYLKEGDVILTTLGEHSSNILPWFEVAKTTGAKIEYIQMNNEGIIDLKSYSKQIRPEVKIVTLAQVSNVLGHINPIKEMTQLAHEVGAIVVVDGAQSIPHLKVDMKDLNVDFFAFSGHKMLGPTGIGVLYGKYGLLEKMKPIKLGGGANARFNKKGEVLLSEIPTRFEAGTPNIAGILGLDAAITYLEKVGQNNIHAYEKELRNYLMSQIEEMDHLTIYNPSAESGIVSFNVKDIFAQDVCSYLNHYGFALRAGNHCAKILHEVIGSNETCRISLYFYNTKEEIDRFVEVISEISLEKTIDLYL